MALPTDRPETPAAATPETGVAARRRFLTQSATAVCGAALFGLGLMGISRQARALPPQSLRPPGALDEARFQSACVRCGLCVRDCPFGTLRLAAPGDPAPTGTPYFVAREVPCEMCEHLPCVKACPTGALAPELTAIDNARMGLAVLIDQENCLNFLGLRCDVCYRICPAIDRAITLEKRHNPRSDRHALLLPVVHSDACTGCGKCEKGCVLERPAIKVLPIPLAQGQLGAHYRKGWEEKARAGAPLLPDMIELPVRRPGHE